MGVHQFLGIGRHGFGDLGMAMSQGGDVNAGGEIEVAVAIDIR